MENNLINAAEILNTSNYLIVGLGAGASADSGLPTFATLPNYSDNASLDALFQRPLERQRFWLEAYDRYHNAVPHAGYQVLEEMSKNPTRKLIVITTNIDGMAKKTFSLGEVDIFEIHGSLSEWQCGGVRNDSGRYPMILRERCSEQLFDIDTIRPLIDNATIASSATVDQKEANRVYAKCPNCRDGLLRPHVYLFGDGNKHFVNHPVLQGHDKWVNLRVEITRACQSQTSKVCLLELGCGMRVPTIRRRFEEILIESNEGLGEEVQPFCSLIRVNPEHLSFLSSTTNDEKSEETNPQKGYMPIQMTAMEMLTQINDLYNK